MSNEEKERLKDRICGMSMEQIEEIVKHIPSSVMFNELLRRDKCHEQIISDISNVLKNHGTEKGR